MVASWKADRRIETELTAGNADYQVGRGQRQEEIGLGRRAATRLRKKQACRQHQTQDSGSSPRWTS